MVFASDAGIGTEAHVRKRWEDRCQDFCSPQLCSQTQNVSFSSAYRSLPLSTRSIAAVPVSNSVNAQLHICVRLTF